jgi:hypothetical protein
MERDTAATLQEVTATLNFLEPSSERPYVYMYDLPPGVPQRTGDYRGHSMAIRNARPVARQLSLDREGFVLLRQETRVSDFADEDEVKSVYHGELENFLRDLTGASRALMFDYTLRSAGANGGSDKFREPVKVAHNDYTFVSGPQRLRDLLPPEEASVKRRFGIYNVWRPIRGTVYDTPLALCDARTIASGDLIATEMRYRDRLGETFAIAFNPAQRWYYAPRMKRDEVFVFKCFDSAPNRGPPFAAHTAFDDPSAPPGTPPRESIEARLLVLYPPA